TAKVEQRFEATTVADVMQNGRVLGPAGSRVRGVVAAVDPADRLHRAGSLTLSFDEIEVRGRSNPIRAQATNVFESGGIREEGGTAGIGAGAGAIVGGILGGLKGAILGAVIGAGGAIAATEGKDIALPAGSIIRIRLDSPLTVREPRKGLTPHSQDPKEYYCEAGAGWGLGVGSWELSSGASD